MGVVPPLVGVAVKVTPVLGQTLFAEAEMEILAASTGFTTMVTALEVAGLALTQAALDVNTQVTTSLLAGV